MKELVRHFQSYFLPFPQVLHDISIHLFKHLQVFSFPKQNVRLEEVLVEPLILPVHCPLWTLMTLPEEGGNGEEERMRMRDRRGERKDGGGREGKDGGSYEKRGEDGGGEGTERRRRGDREEGEKGGERGRREGGEGEGRDGDTERRKG
jgi:hypothetical protein